MTNQTDKITTDQALSKEASSSHTNGTGEYSLATITFWLAFGTFVIGCSEFAAMGLLPYFAKDFGISEKVAGHAISAYAIGVVVGAPLITIFFSRLTRRTMLISMMVFYAGGNLLTALAWSE